MTANIYSEGWAERGVACRSDATSEASAMGQGHWLTRTRALGQASKAKRVKEKRPLTESLLANVVKTPSF